jgi:hypothetical protein
LLIARLRCTVDATHENHEEQNAARQIIAGVSATAWSVIVKIGNSCGDTAASGHGAPSLSGESSAILRWLLALWNGTFVPRTAGETTQDFMKLRAQLAVAMVTHGASRAYGFATELARDEWIRRQRLCVGVGKSGNPTNSRAKGKTKQEFHHGGGTFLGEGAGGENCTSKATGESSATTPLGIAQFHGLEALRVNRTENFPVKLQLVQRLYQRLLGKLRLNPQIGVEHASVLNQSVAHFVNPAFFEVLINRRHIESPQNCIRNAQKNLCYSSVQRRLLTRIACFLGRNSQAVRFCFVPAILVPTHAESSL